MMMTVPKISDDGSSIENFNEILSELQQNAACHGKSAQWLSGEGAGSWFVFEAGEAALKVTRYSPDGKMECRGEFEGAGIGHVASGDQFTVDYPSNCNQVLLKNGTKTPLFTRKRDA